MNEAVLKNLVQRARMLNPHAATIQEEGRPAVESMATAVLQELNVNEVGQILGVWQQVFGMKLDQNKVMEHLESLRRWQRQIERNAR
jgi:thiamine phosphate synthase YjbQ (UPF0047 family)